MSPGPVFLPLTTISHHLPSSWTNFPKLHTPVTLPAVLHHHGLFIHLTPATLPVGIVHVSVWSHCVSHARNTCTVCLFLYPSRLPAFFLPCWPFCYIYIYAFSRYM